MPEEVRKKYQKRHYIVKAVQWFPGMIIEDVIEIHGHARLVGPNGGKLINQGDWIIFHEDSREEVKPDKDFNEQYELYCEEEIPETCDTCMFFNGSLGSQDRGENWEWHEEKDNIFFIADGTCNKHTGLKEDNAALAVCSSEDILGEFIVKKYFSCIDYEFDELSEERRFIEIDQKIDQKTDLERRQKFYKQKEAEEIQEELARIREGLKNGICIKPRGFYSFPEGINSIIDYLTEEEKKEWRELDVQNRLKKGASSEEKRPELG